MSLSLLYYGKSLPFISDLTPEPVLFQPFTAQANAPAPAARTGALDPANFIAFKVMEKEQLTHNTYRVK